MSDETEDTSKEWAERALKAEAERDRLREALEDIAAPSAFGQLPEDRIEGMRDVARAALKGDPQ